METSEVRALLQAEVEKHRCAKAAAWKWNMDHSHLLAMLSGRKPPGLKVLRLLGLKRVMTYEKL